MPKEFRVEAVATAVYILNKCPTKSICDKTQEEAWSGRRPTIRQLGVFGCITYEHVSDQLRKKVDDKGEMCIFIGFNTNSKAYKLYNLKTKKVIITWDVTFDEKGMWDWSTKSQNELVVISNHYEENKRQPDPTLDEPKSFRRSQRNP